MSTALGLRSIDNIIATLRDKKESLFIPSYQRGYRWTKREVKDLLDDLWDFSKTKSPGEIYCLQPVVVTRRTESSWEVIDGQQRLTTIRILLSYINHEVFKTSGAVFPIEYETRTDSQSFLDHIDLTRKDENIDYYHFVTAYQTIAEWYETKGNPQLVTMTLYPVLLESAQVIWYEVDNSVNAIEIFSRINIGKIPLTNAELIKALFLSSDNFQADKEQIRLRQMEIAAEWDRMETALRDPAMWYFLSDPNKKYANRIEFLFDLIAVKPVDGDDFFTFRFFAELFKSDNDILKHWQQIKETFLMFEEWFNDRTLYHLVGYLIAGGHNIKDLRNKALNLTKTAFLAYLNTRISSGFKKPVAELGYHDRETRMALLLFNIRTLLNNAKSNIRFPFDRFKKEKWDIEHIHALQSEIPEKKQHQSEWLREVAAYLKGKNDELTAKAESALLKLENNQEIGFDKIYKEVLDAYTEADDDTDANDISNLALLDATTNRGYKNAVFPIKRQKIITKDENGTFVPLCTKNVFLKYYSEDLSHMYFFGRKDRASYLKAMETTLAPYFPEPNPQPLKFEQA